MIVGNSMNKDTEPLQEERDACEIKTPLDHKIMFRTLENPLRRNIVKSIGAFGKTKKEIIKELGISEAQLKFQIDYLVKNCYAEVDGEKCRLNAKGLDELLVNVK